MEDRLPRKLAAILYADVAGYSRLTGENEESTHRRLGAYLDAFTGAIRAHEGHIAHFAGDAILADFPSVSQALTCAAAVQKDLAERNAELLEECRVQFRIGVNLGEVIVDRDDLYGDGVNVAARLETLAEPGGICVSESVRNAAGSRLPFTYEFLGEREVKNIREPVRAYRAALKPGATLPPPSLPRHPARRLWKRITPAVLAGVVLVIGGTVAWLQPWAPATEPASPERMAYPLPNKPSIAVLPFDNLSGDPDQEYFADGIAEDLMTDLAKISGLFVISRNSAFTYKGKSVKTRQVAEDLGVRYVLEGSVRRVGDQVRINAQLIDATSGGHLWAERYDGSLDDVFAMQDSVTERIVNALAVKLTPEEAQRVGRSRTDNAAAHDAYLLGLSFYYRRTPEDNAKAAAHFEEAINRDPNYFEAYTALAKVYAQGVFRAITYAQELEIYWRSLPAKVWGVLAKGMAQPNADFHVLRSWLASNKRQHDRAIAEAKRALALSPNDADALEAMAAALIYSGRPKEGIEFAHKAMRQNPTLLARPLYLMGLAEFSLGNPDKAIELLERATGVNQDERDFGGVLAAAYGELGRTEQAKAAYGTWSEAFIGKPDLAWSMAMYPFSRQRVLDRLAVGFKGAGVGGGYLPLHNNNKLSGPEIKALLFRRQIEGTDFWNGSSWRQQRTADGTVEHFGYRIHVYMPGADTGIGRIANDMLCEQWPALTTALEICVVIYRIPEDNALSWLGDYVMVTDTGPHPFSLVE